MATLTIKIESEDLAREVLTHLGYLPEDDLPDLVEVEEDNSTLIDALKTWSIKPEEKEEAPRLPKTEVKAPLTFPEPTRKMPDAPKQNDFCTTEEPKEGVEPVDNEMGAPLTRVFTEEMAKERDALYKHCMEVRKTIPPAEERLKTQIDGLMGGDILDYLATMTDHADPTMRAAVKAYVLKEYAGRNLRLWPALQKILEGNS